MPPPLEPSADQGERPLQLRDDSQMTLKIGTRKSTMALAQTAEVCARLKAIGVDAEPALFQTRGDADQTSKLGVHGGKGGAFVDELRQALREGVIDGIMHSLKDVPGNEDVVDLVLQGMLTRQPSEDVLVLRPDVSLADFEAQSQSFRIGTNSVRRAAFLRALYPNLEVTHFRGAADTRLTKLDQAEGQKRTDGSRDEPVHALVMAAAGLARIGSADRIAKVFARQDMLPSACQGIVTVECRSHDWTTRAALLAISDPITAHCAAAEREVLWTLNGDCNSAIAAHAVVTDGTMILDACVLGPATRLSAQVSGPAERSRELGRDAALRLLAQGAADILASS